jgi:hypothetical protein
MMLETMTTVALILGATQSTKHKVIGAMIFLVPPLYHGAATYLMGDQTYYISAGIVGLFVTGILVKFGRCDDLAIAAWTSIFINLFGIITWFMVQDPDQYDRTFLLFWGWVLWILFRGSKLYGMAGNLRVLYRVNRFRRNVIPGLCVGQAWTE